MYLSYEVTVFVYHKIIAKMATIIHFFFLLHKSGLALYINIYIYGRAGIVLSLELQRLLRVYAESLKRLLLPVYHALAILLVEERPHP